LEEAQRAAVKERKAKCEDWDSRYFEQDMLTGQWVYKHSDLRPWDTRNDLFQYECDYIIQTKTRHKTPMIRTSSIISVEPPTSVSCILDRLHVDVLIGTQNLIPLMSTDGRDVRRSRAADSISTSNEDNHSESSGSERGSRHRHEK